MAANQNSAGSLRCADGFLRGLLAFATLAFLGPTACGGDDEPTGPSVIQATWNQDASEFRGSNGRRIQFNCPPDGFESTIWGTDIYTDDSSVCTAAVHAGKITFAQGGPVTFEIRPGQASYAASTRNGVTSFSWDDWVGSFTFP